MAKQTKHELEERRLAAQSLHTDIAPESVKEISAALTALLADVFALYIKTKNFHWHMSGPISGIITSCSMNMVTSSSR
jgi:starvation-inducible DNA-binding protein